MANKEYVDLADLSLYKQLWETRRDEIIEDGITNVGSRDIKKLFGFGGYLVAKSPGLQFTEDFRNFTDALDSGYGALKTIVQVGNTYYAFNSNYVYISSDLNQWTTHQMTFDRTTYEPNDFKVYYHEGVFYHFEVSSHKSGNYYYPDIYLHQSTDGYTWTSSLTNIGGFLPQITTSPTVYELHSFIIIQNGNYAYLVTHTSVMSGIINTGCFCYSALNDINRFYRIGSSEKHARYNDAFLLADNKALFSQGTSSSVEIEVSQNGTITRAAHNPSTPVNCMNDGNEYGFYSQSVYINGEEHAMGETIVSMMIDEADGAYAFALNSNNMYQLFSNGEVKLVGEYNWRPTQQKEPVIKTCLLL